MGATRTAELIALTSGLPLGDPRSEANYSHFFEAVGRSNDETLSSISTRLEGKRKLALLLACIWTVTQVEEQNQPPVERAAEAAMAIMEEEEVPFTRSDLLHILRWYRQSFHVDGVRVVGFQDERSNALVASRFLEVILG